MSTGPAPRPWASKKGSKDIECGLLALASSRERLDYIPQPEAFSGVSGDSCMRYVILLIALALLLLPAAAQAAPRQIMSFEAPRELLDDGRRDITLDEIRRFGVSHVRQLIYWKDFAPRPARKRKPRFDASDHRDYPSRTWGRLDRLFAAAEARD